MRGLLIVTVLAVILGAVGWMLTAPEAVEDGAPRGPRPASVIVAPVGAQTFSDAIEALGTTRGRESVLLTATITEKVTRIAFVDGAQVAAGDVLVELEDSSERAELAAAKARRQEKRRALERAQRLVQQQTLSDAELDVARAELESATAAVAVLEAALAERVIRAPFAGRLGLRGISVGTLIKPGDPITTIHDIAVLNVDFTVPEVYLSRLRVGHPVRIRSAAFAGRAFSGELAAIGTQVDPVTRAITARASLPNPAGDLRPGMLVELEVVSAEREALAVPEAALVVRGDRHLVFVNANGSASQREVVTGVRRNGLVEVRQGLQAGDSVVVHGASKLGDGQPLRVLAEFDGSTPIAELIRQGGAS